MRETPAQAPTGPATGGATASGTTETETNPAGDIPDNQAYVPFTPPGGGFTVKIPEGWASTTAGPTTTFTSPWAGFRRSPAVERTP